MLEPISEALLGKIVKANNKFVFEPGVLVSMLTALEKLLILIPDAAKPVQFKDKIDALTAQRETFTSKAEILTLRLQDMFHFLSSLSYQLDPQAVSKHLAHQLQLPKIIVIEAEQL